MAAGGDPPRAQPLDDVDHVEVAVEKERVDREAHESGVNPRRRGQKQALAGGQAAAAKEADHAGERTVRQRANAKRVPPCQVHYELCLERQR